MDSLVLHSDGKIYLYNLSSSTLFIRNVTPVISYFNTIKGSVLYITSSNSLYQYSLPSMDFLSVFNYDLSTYSV